MNELLEKYLNYVCNRCLLSLDKCQCKYRSYTLIQIDRKIQDTIKLLNEKFYQTVASCEGHYNEVGGLYISFMYDYNFDVNSLPIGFKYNNKQRILSYNYKDKVTEQQFEIEKEKATSALLSWANNLTVYSI